MTGMTGRFVWVAGEGDRVATTFDSSVDLSLSPLLQRMFPLVKAYIAVAHYLEDCTRLDRGLVSHALGSALRSLVKEYLVLVAQLETQFAQGTLSLQRLWFYVQPCMATMQTYAVLFCHPTVRPMHPTSNTVRAPRAVGGPSPYDRLHRLVTELSIERPVPVDKRATTVAILVSDKTARGPAPPAQPTTDRARGGAILTILWDRMQALSGYTVWLRVQMVCRHTC